MKIFMKRTTYFLLLITVFYSCRKDKSPAFDKTADERINETLSQYQSVLTASPNGWTGTLVTKLGLTFSFYFRFGDNNRVVMYSDFDTTTAGTAKESSFRLKALQQPALIFDTYSYIHLPADPDAGVNGGYYGAGLVSDFEFSIDALTADSVLLTGRFNGSSAILRKASQQDRAAWENRDIYNTVNGLKSLDKILNYFKRLKYNGTEYETQFNKVFKAVTISWKDGATPVSLVVPYYITPAGVQFGSSITNGNQVINGFTITGWDQPTSTVKVKVNNTDASIAGAIKPINPDITAGRRWWQWGNTTQSYYYSQQGFHVDGVDDAYGVNTLHTDTSVFDVLVYWPGIKPPTGSAFDAFMPYYYNPSSNSSDWNYGTGQQSVFLSDGRVRFNLLGDLTGGDWPTSGPALQTRTQLFITDGYWFVQTSETSYDMVSAKDAKAWITWRND